MGQKHIALTAHEGMRRALSAWVFANARILTDHRLTATGNAARLIAAETELAVEALRAGALGGDMELGALMAGGKVDILIFFADPLGRQSYDVDPAPLIRVATLSQTALALNEATADFLVRSELLGRPYHRPAGADALPVVPHQIDSPRAI